MSHHPDRPATSGRVNAGLIATTIGIVTMATLNLVRSLQPCPWVLRFFADRLHEAQGRLCFGGVEHLVIIFGMLALGHAMDSTGASLMIAETMTGMVKSRARHL